MIPRFRAIIWQTQSLRLKGTQHHGRSEAQSAGEEQFHEDRAEAPKIRLKEQAANEVVQLASFG